MLSLKELTSPLGMFGELTYGFLLKFCFILLMDTIWMGSLISALSELPGPSQPHTTQHMACELYFEKAQIRKQLRMF